MRAHGQRAKYVFDECRCDACRTANREWVRLYRARRRRTAREDRTEPGDALRVECWCQTTSVLVPQKEVMQTLTRSCGRPFCDSLDRKARKADK